MNAFYNDFDTLRYDGTGPKASEDDYRTAFQIDRDRVIFSYAFRRLQSKTQVFQTGVDDYYRTRLTHSIEVAKIGRSITEWLSHQAPDILPADSYIDADLVEAAGLAHDLGHPPFGHIGERRLNTLMKDAGGFEGNAQTARYLTQLIYKNGLSGMKPTRAFLDAVMKYKSLYAECVQSGNGAHPKNHFLYDEQNDLRAFILGSNKDAHLETSLECQILDWADDIAYSLHDLMDGIQTGFLSYTNLCKWADHHLEEKHSPTFEFLLGCIRDGAMEAKFSMKIGACIRASSLVERKHPMEAQSMRYKYELHIDETILEEIQFYKQIARSLVFQSPKIQQLEYKGGRIVERIFNVLRDEIIYSKKGLKLIDDASKSLILSEASEAEQLRRLCDHIASLSDLEAIRLYKSLFDPNEDFGRLF